MIAAIRKRIDQEGGFTLIELLVVVLIIGILAAIAIPAFLNQRESAQIGQVESDLRNLAMEVETFRTGQGSYPEENDDDTDGLGAIDDVSVSNDTVDVQYELVGDDDEVFCLSGDHDLVDSDGEGVVAVYDSSEGGIIGDFNVGDDSVGDVSDDCDGSGEEWFDGDGENAAQ